MSDRDVEKEYSDAENIQKLERLVECMKTGQPFEIQVAGKRIYVPVRAKFVVEHEIEGDEEELEFLPVYDSQLVSSSPSV